MVRLDFVVAKEWMVFEYEGSRESGKTAVGERQRMRMMQCQSSANFPTQSRSTGGRRRGAEI